MNSLIAQVIKEQINAPYHTKITRVLDHLGKPRYLVDIDLMKGIKYPMTNEEFEEGFRQLEEAYNQL